MEAVKGRLGFALCGSFCTVHRSLEVMRQLKEDGWQITPILSDAVYRWDTRFGSADALRAQIASIASDGIIHSVVDAEPLGPKINLDAMMILPCTGNTLAKLAQGVTDTPVTMAAKAHLRSDRPLIIGLASNDALSANLRNIGTLLCRKMVYFVPLVQDDPENKPHSLVCRFPLAAEALEAAMAGRQLRPLFC